MQNRYKNQTIKYKSIRDDYKTPAFIYEPILKVMKAKEFDIDVCCNEKNIPAKKHYTKVENGLKQIWEGFCFCNPVWSKTSKWLKYAFSQKTAITAFVISSDRFYCDYMQDFVLNNPRCVFLIIPKKQGFIIPGEEEKPIIPSVGVAIIFVTTDKQAAKDIKKRINSLGIFNTTAFQGGNYNDD